MVFLFPSMEDSAACHASHKVFKTTGLALPLPEGLAADRACFARMVNVALTPYCNAEPKTMGSVLVIGLGLVGNFVGQLGRIRGFQTIGIEPNATRRSRALEAGFDAVIDPGVDEPVEVVRELTGGQGAELTVNTTGHAAPFLTALRATAPGGEVSTLGGARHGSQGELAEIFREIHYRHLVVRGGWELRLPLRNAPARRVIDLAEVERIRPGIAIIHAHLHQSVPDVPELLQLPGMDRLGFVAMLNTWSAPAPFRTMPIDLGEIDLAGWLGALWDFGYDGPIVAQAYNLGGDGYLTAKRSIEYIREVWNRFQRNSLLKPFSNIHRGKH